MLELAKLSAPISALFDLFAEIASERFIKQGGAFSKVFCELGLHVG
jgi:hypothetical protein